MNSFVMACISQEKWGEKPGINTLCSDTDSYVSDTYISDSSTNSVNDDSSFLCNCITIVLMGIHTCTLHAKLTFTSNVPYCLSLKQQINFTLYIIL